MVETFEHSTQLINQSKFPKVPKVFKPTNKKTYYYETLGTSVIVPSLFLWLICMFLSITFMNIHEPRQNKAERVRISENRARNTYKKTQGRQHP